MQDVVEKPLHEQNLKCRSRSGFSLIEVVVATGLCSLVFLAAFSALYAGTRQIDTARTTTIVSQILRDESERLRSLNWSTLQGLPSEEEFTLDSAFSTSTILQDNQFTFKRQVSSGPASLETLEITISAVWIDGYGNTHNRQIQSIVAKGGMYDYVFYSNTGSSS